MITDILQLRPRYGEVDRMGYVYHANYVSYCHVARTEMLRKLRICDCFLERNKIMLPVISMNLNYRKPAGYDELLTIKTTVKEMPRVRFHFDFEITKGKNEIVCMAHSTVVFVNASSKKPMQIPIQVKNILENYFQDVEDLEIVRHKS